MPVCVHSALGCSPCSRSSPSLTPAYAGVPGFAAAIPIPAEAGKAELPPADAPDVRSNCLLLV